MDIKELQKELAEKILLIPVGDDSEAISRKALEIINELKDHINDDIIIDNKRFTALDCVIFADSQGDNPRISERPRINNQELKELENAIRNIGGKTSEELGRIDSAVAEQPVQTANNRLRYRIIGYSLCVFVLFASSLHLIYRSRDNNRAGASTKAIAGSIGLIASLMLVGLAPILVMCKKPQTPHADLENVTVESVVEERQPTVESTRL